MKNYLISFSILAASLLACVSIPVSAQNFGSVNIGESSTTTITVPITTAGTVGSISVRLLGAENLDFTNAGGGTCTVGTGYAAKATCTVKVKFAPKYAGWRQGAVVLFSEAGGTGTVLANVTINGTGSGPQIAYGPGTAIAIDPTVEGAGHFDAENMAIDGAGDLFIADPYNNRVVEVPAGGGARIVIAPSVDGIALGFCGSVAIDGAGDLFITDKTNYRLIEAPAGGGPAFALATTVNGTRLLSEFGGLALDGAGNLFIVDFYNGRVLEVPHDGGATTVVDIPLVNGLAVFPTGLAIDAAGDLFIGDYRHNRAVELPAGGGAPISIGSTLATPPYDQGVQGLAVDAAGDLFLALFEYGVLEVPANGGAPFLVFGSASINDLIQVQDVAVDEAGNLFIVHGYSVTELPSSKPPALSFANTGLGETSADSPQTVRVQNIGNQPLIFTSIRYPRDFPEASGDSSACASSTSLSAGQPCDLAVDFIPQALGPLSEDVTMTDNSLNKVGSTQEFAVSGTGFAAQSITFATLPNVPYTVATIPLTATASSGLAVSYSVTGPATVSGSKLSITGLGLISVTASQAGNSSYGPAIPVTQKFSSLLPCTVKIVSSSDLNPTLGWPVTFTAQVSCEVRHNWPGGTVSFYAGSTLLGSAGLTYYEGGPAFTTSNLPAGTDAVTAQYSGDLTHYDGYGNYIGATSSAVTEVVTPNPTLPLTSSANPAAAYAPFTLTARVEYPTGSAVPTGTVNFYMDRVGLGRFALSNGIASYQVSGLAPGWHSVGVQYNGDKNYRGIQGVGLWQAVSKIVTSVALTASPNPVAVGAQLTVTATVATTLAGKIPTGTVNLYVDGKGLGRFALSNGSASYQTSSLAAGKHTFGAQYNGDGNYTEIAPSGVTVTVQ